MEELFAYALLFDAEFELGKNYNSRLNKLFLAEPSNEIFLDGDTMEWY